MPPLSSPSRVNPEPSTETIKPENVGATLENAQSNNVVIQTPAGVGIKIDDVNQSLWQYVRQRKLWELILFAPLVIVWEAFIVFLFVKYLQMSSSGSSNGGRVFGYLIAIPFAVFSGWFYKLKKQFEDAFLQEFALANGYSFDKNGQVDEAYGTIFRLTGDQRVSDVVTGTYDNNNIRLFICELTTRIGNSTQKYQDTVIELDLHGQLPNLLMVNKKSRYGQLNLAGSFGIKNTFSLEGDFNEYFTLYGQENNQIEALEVFSPDTMALMEDESKHFTVEFSGNRIYIYANGFLTNTNDLTQAFALAKKLIAKIAPLASRLQNDSAIIPVPTNVIQTRKSHPLVQKLVLGLTIVLTVGGLGLMVVGLIGGEHQSKIDTTNAISISNDFMQDLGHGNITSAKQLEGPHLQQNSSQNQYLSSANFSGFEDSSIIDQKTGTDNNGTWVAVLYEDHSNSEPFYIKLVLAQYGQDWRIWDFEASYNKLSL